MKTTLFWLSLIILFPGCEVFKDDIYKEPATTTTKDKYFDAILTGKVVIYYFKDPNLKNVCYSYLGRYHTFVEGKIGEPSFTQVPCESIPPELLKTVAPPPTLPSKQCDKQSCPATKPH